jgi:regulator of protease activity HflC (stomatin/prohibitin superfamily)
MGWIIMGVFIALVIVVVGGKIPQTQQYRRWPLAAGVFAVFLALSTFRMVPAGHVGVKVLFGQVLGSIPEGLHLVNPLISLERLSVRTQEMFEHSSSPSKEGLNVELEVTCLYHLMANRAAEVYQQIGLHYEDVVVKPQFRSAIRGVTVRHEAKDLYTSGRELIATEIFHDLEGDLKKRGVNVEKILLRRIQLPQSVVEAINSKLAAEQDAQRMQFVLDKERQEAERKRVEAQGIQDFQRIVSQGISEPLLRWKGIEATEHLSKSPNTKVIIVGGKDGLPLILNTGPALEGSKGK